MALQHHNLLPSRHPQVYYSLRPQWQGLGQRFPEQGNLNLTKTSLATAILLCSVPIKIVSTNISRQRLSRRFVFLISRRNNNADGIRQYVGLREGREGGPVGYSPADNPRPAPTGVFRPLQRQDQLQRVV